HFIQQVFGAAALRLPPWFERIYTAQTCWDAVMAASMRAFLASRPGKGKKGVIIAGSAHVAYGLGIPFRYRLGKRRARLLTIVPVRVKTGDEGAEEHPMLKMMAKNMPPVGVFSAGIADYVLGLPAEEEGLPSLDVSGHEDDGVFVVDKVGEESLPHQLGLRKGDRVLAVDGQAVTSQAELRLLLGMERETPPHVRLERVPQPAAEEGK
ncbi:MAG: ChaN family lipoprotein, partial [Candidatus Aminicenantes bacterium]|nr:ChaN family lipoprotein [Candidatus Aminicenantes bacterium]